MSNTPRVDGLAALIRRELDPRHQIEQIDQLLFDAGLLLMSAKTKAARVDVDHKITEARVKLEQLRCRLA